MPSAGADEIAFSAKVAQAAAAPTRAESTAAEESTPIDETFGTIYIHHTQNERYSHGKYSDMTEDDASYTSSGGILQQQTPVSGCWYWGGPDKQHLFHAWNLPHDGEDQTDTGEHHSLATLDKDGSNRLGRVDLSMNKKSYTYTVKGDDMAESTYHRLSNLEYFIGAVCGPLDLQTNGSIAVLYFKHLVAKIIIENIQYIHPDGGVSEVSETIRFSMPNMPNRAYWTTGVPASEPPYNFEEAAKKEPRLLPLKSENTGFEYTLDDTDYGVEGKLQNKSCFYIYPCKFKETNPSGNELGEIEFFYNNSWYYGSLASITTLEGLNAGECISLTLRLKDGNVSGLYPHINEWGFSDQPATHHDKPGIYNVDDWKRFVDYLRELMNWKEGDPEPQKPAGLFDEKGNVNLYCDLDLTSASNYTETGLLDYLMTEGNKIIGNGHRLKSATQWDKDKYENVLEDLWVTTNGEDIEFER